MNAEQHTNKIPATESVVVVLPLYPGHKQVRVLGCGKECFLSPDQAYAFGNSLQECAKECGYDEDTGETHEVI